MAPNRCELTAPSFWSIIAANGGLFEAFLTAWFAIWLSVLAEWGVEPGPTPRREILRWRMRKRIKCSAFTHSHIFAKTPTLGIEPETLTPDHYATYNMESREKNAPPQFYARKTERRREMAAGQPPIFTDSNRNGPTGRPRYRQMGIFPLPVRSLRKIFLLPGPLSVPAGRPRYRKANISICL